MQQEFSAVTCFAKPMANKLLAYTFYCYFLSYYTKDNIFASGQFLSGKEKANSS